MSVVWFVSVTRFRRGASLPLVVGVMVVTKAVDNHHPEELEQEPYKQHSHNDPLCHGCVFFHRWIRQLPKRISSKPRASSEMRTPSVVVCSFSQNCTRAQAPKGGWKAVHMNRKRFGTESNLMYRIGSNRPAEGVLRGGFMSVGQGEDRTRRVLKLLMGWPVRASPQYS
jgi:hypothetical protein